MKYEGAAEGVKQHDKVVIVIVGGEGVELEADGAADRKGDHDFTEVVSVLVEFS